MQRRPDPELWPVVPDDDREETVSRCFHLQLELK